MITSNSRLFLAIILSLFLFFGIRHLYTNPQILNPENVLASITQKTAEIKTKIFSIRLPNLSNLFSLKFFLPSDNIAPSQNKFGSGQAIKPYNNNNNSLSFPMVIQPTTSNQQQPTIANRQPTTKYYPSPYKIPISPPRPTATPRPTAIPKPTETPKPTNIPLLKILPRRPGNSFEEVISIVSPIMCVPKALLWGTLINEYGAWLNKIEADWDNKNTYPGFDATAIQWSQTSFGVMQMMGDTWFRIKPYVMKKFIVDDMSLNVTFDSIASLAYHVRNVSLAGQDNQPCDDWSVEYILYAACRHNGACPANTFGQSQYYNAYTYRVCEEYNKHSDKKKNCQP